MKFKATCRWPLICLVSVVGLVYPQIIGDKTVVAIRVAFQADASQGTTGDGRFLFTGENTTCGDYTLDPPPHNRDYFLSHLKALNHYFSNVSRGNLTIDLMNSNVFPLQQDSVYTLPHPMNYYHPYGSDETQYEQLITELYRDAVTVAFNRDSIDFSRFDIVMVFHAGVGQDFALPFLDPTPEDIPSTFVDNEMIQTHLGLPAIPLGNAAVTEGIILPETQNHLLYPEMVDLFGSDFASCDYQFSLTGTAALLTGFLLGLPPLWNTETGESGVGIFGLMDQGSNNGRGIIPAPPDAWTRLYSGWESPYNIPLNSRFDAVLRPAGPVGKIAIGPDEYYLIENRSNDVRDGVSIDSMRYAIWQKTNTYPPYVKVLLDSVPVTKDSNQVIVAVPNYDIGLPNSGLLIWQVDENKIAQGLVNHAVNNDKEHRGVDLIEADGAKDIGFQSIFPFNDPSAGYFADMWYRGNLEYLRFNPEYAGGKIAFGPYTVPGTRTFSGAASYIAIDSIDYASDTMSVMVHSTFLASGFPSDKLSFRLRYDLDQDGIPEYIGGTDSLWVSSDSIDSSQRFYISENPIVAVIVTGTDDYPGVGIIEQTQDSTFIRMMTYHSGTVIQEWVYSVPRLNGMTIQGVRERQAVDFVYPQEIYRFDGVSQQVISTTKDWSRRYRARMTGNDNRTDTLEVFVDSRGAVYLAELYIPDPGPAQQVGLFDLNDDGHLDVLVLDTRDDIFAFDRYGIKLPGFPITVPGASRWLSYQLFDDPYPEIVVQDSLGDFHIYNWKGDLVYYIANPSIGELVQLGSYQGYNAIFTTDAVWQFDSNADDNTGNGWIGLQGSPVGDRLRIIRTDRIDEKPEFLMDKSRTYVYPNPVTEGKTTFRATVGEVDYIECNIYDIAGYFTASMRIDISHSGFPVEWTWQTEGVEPGVYFARVKAVKGSRSESKTIKVGVLK